MGTDLPVLSVMESSKAVVRGDGRFRDRKALGSNHPPALLSFSVHFMQSTCSDWLRSAAGSSVAVSPPVLQ